MGTKAAAFALDPGLGLDLATFKTRWSAWLTKANKNGKLNSLRLGDVALAPKSGSPNDSTFTVTLYHRDDPVADVTLSGVVGKDSEAIKQVVLSKTEGAKWAASATDALAFHGMVAAVTPDVDDKALIQDLDMTPGSDTSSVRGKAKFSYTSTPDGLTASYTVSLATEVATAPTKAGEGAGESVHVRQPRRLGARLARPTVHQLQHGSGCWPCREEALRRVARLPHQRGEARGQQHELY